MRELEVVGVGEGEGEGDSVSKRGREETSDP